MCTHTAVNTRPEQWAANFLTRMHCFFQAAADLYGAAVGQACLLTFSVCSVLIGSSVMSSLVVVVICLFFSLVGSYHVTLIV